MKPAMIGGLIGGGILLVIITVFSTLGISGTFSSDDRLATIFKDKLPAALEAAKADFNNNEILLAGLKAGSLEKKELQDELDKWITEKLSNIYKDSAFIENFDGISLIRLFKGDSPFERSYRGKIFGL